MTRYAAFLRGVNVGGVNIKMAEVADGIDRRRIHQRAHHPGQWQRVADAAPGVATVRKKAEAALRETFGYDAWVLVYDLDTVRAIVDAYPFEREVDGHHSYVTFVTDRRCSTNSPRWRDNAGPDEKIARGDGVVYWQVLKGSTLDSTIGKTMGKKRYKSSTTTRNLRTLAKVLR